MVSQEDSIEGIYETLKQCVARKFQSNEDFLHVVGDLWNLWTFGHVVGDLFGWTFGCVLTEKQQV